MFSGRIPPSAAAFAIAADKQVWARSNKKVASSTHLESSDVASTRGGGCLLAPRVGAVALGGHHPLML